MSPILSAASKMALSAGVIGIVLFRTRNIPRAELGLVRPSLGLSALFVAIYLAWMLTSDSLIHWRGPWDWGPWLRTPLPAVVMRVLAVSLLGPIAEELIFRGWLFGMPGDGIFALFESAIDAVRCALGLQSRLAALPELSALRLRIGVHLGEVLFQDELPFGESLVIAARLESLAEPGGILVSSSVMDAVAPRIAARFVDKGAQGGDLRRGGVLLGAQPGHPPTGHQSADDGEDGGAQRDRQRGAAKYKTRRGDALCQRRRGGA